MSAEFTPVELLSPDGAPHIARTPTELNNLIYGHGYTKVGDKAYAEVVPTAPPAEDDSSAAKKEDPSG